MSFFPSPIKSAMTGALNGLNALPFELTDEMYYLTDITPTSGIYDTIAKVVATGRTSQDGDMFYGSAPITYNRYNLTKLFRGVSVTLNKGSAVDTNGLLPQLANQYGVSFAKGDLEVLPLVGSAAGDWVELIATPNHPFFSGSFHIQLE